MTTQAKKNKKQIIIDAAADLFTEKGFKASSIRDLAVKVGLEPSSIYSHIHSKEELLVTICLECAEKFTKGMNEIFTESLSPEDKVSLLVRLHVELAYNDPSTVAVFSDEWKHLPADTLAIFLQSRKEYGNKFKLILKKGIAEQQFEDMDVQIMFNTIINALRWPYFSVKKHKKEVLIKQLIHLIHKAIKK